MTELSHTPGPWEKHDILGEIIIKSNHGIVAGCAGIFVGNIKANAHLIAAAPVMLEVLIIQYRLEKAPPTNKLNMSRLKSIIEKATGKKIEDMIK